MNKTTAQQGLNYWKHWRKGYLAAQLSLQYNDDSGLKETGLGKDSNCSNKKK